MVQGFPPFGMRKHPIDGFNKMHRGTDFAAQWVLQ